MQPDLPWNVAGIPPEAREAARAAARREGLSVGEWLTRKILRTMSEAANGIDSTSEHWRSAAVSSANAYRTIADSAAEATRDTEEMLARVSRSEDETASSYRRIEEHLKGVARRLDQAERSQAENNRAMSKAAAEINVAAREQSQAFDQLDSHVMALAERLDRVEQHASGTAGMKDAIKGLHGGLARLADQIAETAKQSGGQITTLAENVETLAGRLSQARREAEAASRNLKDDLGEIESRLRLIEADDGPSKAVSELKTALDQLGSRLGENEAQTAGTIARLEDSIGKLEKRSDDPALEKKLAGLEQALADLTRRTDNQRPAEGMTDELRQISERLDAADRQHRRDIAELRAAIEEAEESRAAIQAASAPQPQTVQQPAQPATNGTAQQNDGFDLPPFPDSAPPFPGAQDNYHGDYNAAFSDGFAPPPFEGAQQGFANEYHFSGVQNHDVSLGNGFDSHGGQSSSADSYIAATRRQARASAEAQHGQGEPATFSWSASTQQPKDSGGRGRYVVIGGVAVLVAALGAGAVLLRGGADQPQPAAHVQINDAPAMHGSTVPEKQPATTENAAPEAAQTAPATTSTPAPTPSKPKPQPRPATPAAAKVTPMERLTSAAKAGSTTAETVLGLKYLDGDGVTANEAEGARWLERAAKQGQPVAEYRLGTLYERGHGVPADAKQAASWYEAAAKQGNRKAMHNLAVAYAQGNGVPKNYQTAAQWFSKAAALGLRDSQFNLAVLYERGMGVTQNLGEAYKWYAIAAAGGDSESKARVSALASQISPAQRSTAQHAADSFKPVPIDRTANVAPTMADL